jgi:hypothetical protein
MAIEVSWVEDDQHVWHQSPHAIGYVESTNPWIFTTACGRQVETATPPLPLESAPASDQRCSECEAPEASEP